MRLRLTLFLLLLNVGLFSYLFYLEDQPIEGDPSRQVFAPGVIERAEEIAIAGSNLEHPWTARRNGERWMVESPVRWPANPYALERLLDQLRSLRWETKFPVNELEAVGRSIADYGLNDDSATLTLRTEERALALRVGAPTEIGSRLYLLSPDGKEIFVVSRDFLTGLDLSPESLVNRRVLSIPPFETRSIFLQAGENGGVRVELAREGESWTLRAPIRVAASTEAINAALEIVYQVEIGDFVEVSPQEHGLATPFLRLNINGNNRQQTLLLGNIVDPDAAQAERYAKLEALPAVFTVAVGPFEVWQTAQESLRERRFMDFNPANASAVEIKSGERSLNLQKLESGRWQLVTTGADGSLRTLFADTAVMDDLLQRLSGLEVLRFESDAPSNQITEDAGLNAPQRQITVRLRNDQSLSLQLGDFVFDDRTNRLYARRANSSSIYVTTASILSATPLNELHYRERVAGSLASGARLEAVTVRDLLNATVLLDTRAGADGSLQPVEGSLSADEQTALDALTAAFRRFPVRRFIAESFSDPLELDDRTTLPWAFAVEATVRLPGAEAAETVTRRYVLTERLGGLTQFAGSEEPGLVFTLPLELIDALHPILFTRPRPDASLNPEPAETAPVISPAPAPSPPEPPARETTSTPAG